MNKKAFVAVLFIFAGMISKNAMADPRCEDLIRSAKSADTIEFSRSVNEINRNGYFSYCKDIFLDFWYLNSLPYAGVSKYFLMKNENRIEIAFVLLMAENNRKINIDINPLLKYVRGLRIDDGCVVYNKSLLSLAWTLDSDDLERIKKEVLAERSCSFRQAALVLVRRCDTKDQDVKRIQSLLKNKENRDFLREKWPEFSRMREKICRDF